jgi:hypothetical protein
MRKIGLLLAISVMFFMPRARAIDASQFDELVGYTVVACTHAAGELEGADFDKLIKLDNGMIFEFQTYSYFYAYRPDVVIFSKAAQYQGKSVTLYKLIIEDEDDVFDVTRVR